MWEVTHHLIRRLDARRQPRRGRIARTTRPSQAEVARDLTYRLYTVFANAANGRKKPSPTTRSSSPGATCSGWPEKSKWLHLARENLFETMEITATKLHSL